MKQAKQYIIVCILLLAILIPFAEKAIHEFSHIDAAACTETTTHFHAGEHDCKLCDLNVATPLVFDPVQYAPLAEEREIQFTNLPKSIFSAERILLVPARAPPVA